MTARIQDYVKYLIAERDDNGRVLLDVGTVKDLLAEIDRLTAKAATHLADQDLLVAKERQRVAKECCVIIRKCNGEILSIQEIESKYGVEE